MRRSIVAMALVLGVLAAPCLAGAMAEEDALFEKILTYDFKSGGGELQKVAELLVRFGDLEAVDAPPTGATRYEGAVAGAVARYQYRHGLSTDSIIGPGTLEELNTPMMDRIHQIEWALERFRWLPNLADAGPFIASASSQQRDLRHQREGQEQALPPL